VLHLVLETKPTKRECKTIYNNYKDACSAKGCASLQRDCNGAVCGEMQYRMKQARKCYTLRDLYLRRGCDEVIPTDRDHPGERNNALEKYKNCQEKYEKCCSK